MKKLPILTAAIMLVLVPATSLALDEIQILPSRTKLDASRNRNKRGNATIESKEIAYSVSVTNRSFKELTNVTVKYNIFYALAEFGSTDEPEVKVSAGSHFFPSLMGNKTVLFETEAIKLVKESLDGNWYFTSGASNQARDKVVGVWFKAFDSAGKQIGEYLNPSTLTDKRKWKD